MRFRRNLTNICTAREVCKIPRAKFSCILRLWFFAPLLRRCVRHFSLF